MAVINVIKQDTFGVWRQKTNLLAQEVGDLALLTTPTNVSIVAAVNSIVASIQDSARDAMIRAIVLS